MFNYTKVSEKKIPISTSYISLLTPLPTISIKILGKKICALKIE